MSQAVSAAHILKNELVVQKVQIISGKKAIFLSSLSKNYTINLLKIMSHLF